MTAPGTIVFLDCETTGLDPDRHDIWEIGLIVRQPDFDDAEYRFCVRPDLSQADPIALRIGDFYARTFDLQWSTGACNLAVSNAEPRWSSAAEVAEVVARLVDGAHIVGAVPDFDVAFLTRFLREYGWCWTAHYHLIDVENLAVGYLAHEGIRMALPWDSDGLSQTLGLDPNDYGRHTALGDARWARAIYDRVLGQGPMPGPLKESAVSP